MRRESDSIKPGLKDFHSLSLDLIALADRGRLISDYFREAAGLLFPFLGAQYLSFLTNHEESFYRLTYYLDKDDHSKLHSLFNPFEEPPASAFEPDTAELQDLNLEQLEALVYSDLDIKTNAAINDTGIYIPHPEKLNIKTEFATVLLLQIKQRERLIGVMTIAWDNKKEIAENEMELFQYIADIIGFSRTHRRAKFLLGERIKELKTIYKISRLGIEIGKSLDDFLAGATEVIPPGFLHPDLACCKIVYANKEFKSSNYKEPLHSLKADLVVGNETKGYVEVSYASETGSISKSPFLKEEESMLRAIAGELGHVAERKHFEEEKERLQQQLLHADRLVTVGQLTAGVAHELNEPLNGILGFAQLIKKYGNIDQNVEQDVDKIIKASLHGREIIRKLMLFSRQTEPEKKLFNINERIDDGLYLLETRLKKSDVILHKEFADDLPLIEIDPSQFNQVLVNLVVNAIQAMPEGGTLKIRTSTSINTVCVEVEDTGIGMTEEEIDKIFIPFYTTKCINEGAGLGLPVALGIAQSHNGTIDVKSEPGKGTVFTVKLPVKEEINYG